MAKSATKSKAPAKKAAPKAAQHAPAPAKRTAAATAHETNTPASEARDAAARDQDNDLAQSVQRGNEAAADDKKADDNAPETVHQRVLSNAEVAENAARERGAPAAPAMDRDESPKVTGFRIVADDRPVMVDDEVMLHTPNPIEGKAVNRAIVTKVNPNSTINVKVEIGGPNGGLRQFSSVRNEITEDRSPWWCWPED